MSCSFRAQRLALALLACTPLACAGANAQVASAAQPLRSEPAKPAQAPPPPPRAFVSPYSYEWFIRAELYAADGRYAEAVEAYQMALTSADDDTYVLARLAEAEDHAGDAEAAAHTLETGLGRDPQSEAIWLARARIAERHGDLKVALEAFERAEAAAPHAPDAPFALAALLRRTGHAERASAVLERYTARNPGALRAPPRPLTADPRLTLDTALAFHETARIENLLATTPPDQLGGPVAVAEAYLAIDQPARALELLAERMTADDPDPYRRTLAHAQALLLTGHAEEAASLASSVPKASAHHGAAQRVVRQALEAAGLPALADEVQASEPAPRAASELGF
jgi:tetratricopeptide (TPR) repeat protein